MTEPPARPYPALTVLVADGDAYMRAYLARSLSLFGVGRVILAADGREALHLVAVADLLISDVRMPGLDGEALCRAVHARAPGTPVLLVGDGPHAASSEPDGFLPKPFNAGALRRAVERLVDGGAA